MKLLVEHSLEISHNSNCKDTKMLVIINNAK